MRVILSLLLISTGLLNACKTCYYYDTQATQEDSDCRCTQTCSCCSAPETLEDESEQA